MGEMIAGTTERGICLLEWTDRGGIPKILQRVEKRYRATVMQSENGNELLDQLQREIDAYFEGSLRKFRVPVDVIGTLFEQQVWKELQTIPYGETRSYGQMAALVGKPKASRAVGRANGANYLAVVIPCHRVVESTGGLGGYGGKVWRKKKLLELESGVNQVAFSRS